MWAAIYISKRTASALVPKNSKSRVRSILDVKEGSNISYLVFDESTRTIIPSGNSSIEGIQIIVKRFPHPTYRNVYGELTNRINVEIH
jgi:hypothetical protein